MQLFEPQRGVTLIQSLNTWASSSHGIFSAVSFLADAPILLLPVFLLIVYGIGIKKKDIQDKLYALYVLAASILGVVINLVLQLFLIKARPETVLQGANNLLLKHLPTMSFPSDHAAVSMAFAFAVILCANRLVAPSKKLGIYNKIGAVLILASIVMSIARVAVGVHWPTDIIAGWIIGIIAAIITIYIPKKILTPVIALQERVFKKIGF